ncbi:MAG: GC-type dockerin domain-anchored protein [Phycisphaerales bacterium]
MRFARTSSVLVAAYTLATAGKAHAQPFDFIPVATTEIQHPSGSGTFSSVSLPVTDGEQITFSDGGISCFSSLNIYQWSAAAGNEYAIDAYDTPRPVGTGAFGYTGCTGYLDRLRPADGWQCFYDYDGGGLNFGGLYAAGPGEIAPLVTLGGTVLPQLGLCNSLGVPQSRSEGRDVYFIASGEDGGSQFLEFVRRDSGVTVVPTLNGRLVDSPGGSVRSTSSADSLRAGQLARLGSDNTSWVWQGVFLHDIASGSDTEVINNSGPLLPFAARYSISQNHLALDGAGGVTLLINGRHAATNESITGLYHLRAGAASLIATNATPLPGGGNFGPSFGVGTVAANAVGGRNVVAFLSNNGPTAGTIFLWDGGTLRRLVGPGDIVNGREVQQVAMTRESLGYDPISRGTMLSLYIGFIGAQGSGIYRVGGIAPVCRTDYNGDGGVDGDDVISYFGLWDVSDPSADFNDDGGVDGDDVIAFFTAWDAGGGPGCG